MRRRLYAVVAIAALGLTMPSSAEEPKKLDGTKTKKIEVKGNGGDQQHDDEFILGGPERTKCADPRCLRVDFIYAPDNVAGDVVFHGTWTNPQSDMDIYVVDKDGKDIAHCGGSVGTGEILSIKGTDMKSGEKYTFIVDYYRSFGDEVTATIEFPATYESSGTVPQPIEDETVALFGLYMNCAIDG